MRNTKIWRMIPIIGLLLSLSLAPLLMVSAQASYSDINTITVDQHWFDIIQLDDPDTFRVDETIFINNTGSAPFGGSFQVWLPENSEISAECCGGTPDMACRNHEDGLMECFYFLPMDSNRYVGYPFENSPNLSYYGQEANVTLSVQSETNASNDDSINITAILGSPAIGRTTAHNVTGGIGMTSKNEVIGLNAVLNMYMPYNITTHENITLINNGTEEETFSLDISELPDDWTAKFWNETGIVTNITIGANETKELLLIMTAPSYITPIYLSYTLYLPASEDGGIGVFEKQYIYDNNYVEYYLFLLREDGLQSTSLTYVHPGSGETATWDEGNQRFWYVLNGVDIDNNSTTNINMDMQPSTSSQGSTTTGSLLFLIVIIVIIVIVVITVFALRRSDGIDDEDGLDDEDGPEIEKLKNRPWEDSGDRRARLLEERDMTQKLVERVDSDHKAGLLTDEAAAKMKSSYEVKISGMDETIQELETKAEKPVDEKEMSELISRKKKVLQSIKRIERELEEGLISQDDFDKFNEAYRVRAKEIIRQIDETNN